jgi:hypothetical protein
VPDSILPSHHIFEKPQSLQCKIFVIRQQTKRTVNCTSTEKINERGISVTIEALHCTNSGSTSDTLEKRCNAAKTEPRQHQTHGCTTTHSTNLSSTRHQPAKWYECYAFRMHSNPCKHSRACPYISSQLICHFFCAPVKLMQQMCVCCTSLAQQCWLYLTPSCPHQEHAPLPSKIVTLCLKESSPSST